MDELMRNLLAKYRSVRATTQSLVRNLSAEDQMLQSCPEARPVKWRQAHTTWFFEKFVLRPFLYGYKPFNKEFHHLFNSYDISFAKDSSTKELHSSFSRPSLDEVLVFRAHVDEEIARLLNRSMDVEVSRRVVLGLHHEQQHQELTLVDVKHAFYSNPMRPPYEASSPANDIGHPAPRLRWHGVEGGLIQCGHTVTAEDPADFCFDDETPCHKVLIEPFQIANHKVTCREYRGFMEDGAYARPELWLPDGWEAARRGGWGAPLYWEQDSDDETGWRVFTLRGWHGLSFFLDTPVCHISFFEAEAFARWRGCRLPTEAEWECVASQVPRTGNLLEAGRFYPVAAAGDEVDQFFGDCWEWTASPYIAYPGYKFLPTIFGEYNGRFISGHMVLRGGACVTPEDHTRATYRRFLPPATRRHFTGIRLAV
jgi:ergothioneine biosynthesis protein EgtB